MRSRRHVLTRWPALAGVLLVLGAGSSPADAQEPSAPPDRPSLQAAIDNLGRLDYETRAGAARTVRRAAAAQAVPALLDTVAGHEDGYVRYRALVLLTGFRDPRTVGAMRESLSSPNDRLRTVAYGYFELNPDPAMAPVLLAALEHEVAEFVRPALVRALAAHDDERVRPVLTREAGRGEDFFRSAVIEALGEYRAAYALDSLMAIARRDGPLQDDAALALGRIGDRAALETLSGLQATAPRETQPIVAAAICLLGVNCGSHEGYVADALVFADRTPGFQPLLRSAATALGALGVSGRTSAIETLFRVGIPSRDPARAPIALALATAALRNTPAFLAGLAGQPLQEDAIGLAAEGFDMLEEDLLKERFFAYARRTYWESGPGSSHGRLMQALITELGF